VFPQCGKRPCPAWFHGAILHAAVPQSIWQHICISGMAIDARAFLI
jgi:hypothetical protein